MIELLPEHLWAAPLDMVDNHSALPMLGEMEVEESLPATSADSNTAPVLAVECAVARPTAHIVAIVRRHWRPYCGVLLPQADMRQSFHLFVPHDARVPHVRANPSLPM